MFSKKLPFKGKICRPSGVADLFARLNTHLYEISNLIIPTSYPANLGTYPSGCSEETIALVPLCLPNEPPRFLCEAKPKATLIEDGEIRARVDGAFRKAPPSQVDHTFRGLRRRTAPRPDQPTLACTRVLAGGPAFSAYTWRLTSAARGEATPITRFRGELYDESLSPLYPSLIKRPGAAALCAPAFPRQRRRAQTLDNRLLVIVAHWHTFATHTRTHVHNAHTLTYISYSPAS